MLFLFLSFLFRGGGGGQRIEGWTLVGLLWPTIGPFGHEASGLHAANSRQAGTGCFAFMQWGMFHIQSRQLTGLLGETVQGGTRQVPPSHELLCTSCAAGRIALTCSSGKA